MKKSVLKKAVFRLITLIPLLSILAVILYLLFFTNLPQVLYSQSIRNIYFDCMEFSSADYVYKMKPGTCRLKNFEYDVIFSSDANGFRNGIRETDHYDVAVIGDSNAHGVGVADDQTFSYLLESTYHFKTVNLGIGSYATMRELDTLGKYGKDANYVVVQYCDNDFGENQISLSLNKEDFKSQVEKQRRHYAAIYDQGKAQGYWKPLQDLGIMIRDRSFVSKSTWRRLAIYSRPMEQEASAFARIISRYRRLLEGKRLIVFEVSTWGANSPKFEETFGSELSKLEWLSYKLLNTADILNYQDYFFLDGHSHAVAHRKLAAAISREIAEWELRDAVINNHEAAINH